MASATHIPNKRKMSQEELKMSKTTLSGFLYSALKKKKKKRLPKNKQKKQTKKKTRNYLK